MEFFCPCAIIWHFWKTECIHNKSTIIGNSVSSDAFDLNKEVKFF